MLAAVTSSTALNTAYSGLSHTSSGICTSTNISASKIPPRQDSDLVNTLGGKRAPFPNHLGSFAVLFPLRHDARLDCPPQQCRQLREFVFALLDQLFAKPHQRIRRKNWTEFDAPCMMFPYFTPSYPTRKFSVRFSVDKYLRASLQSSPTGE